MATRRSRPRRIRAVITHVVALGLAAAAVALVGPARRLVRERIETEIARSVGFDVRIGRFGFDREGIVLDDLAGYAPGGGARVFEVAHAHVDLDYATLVRKRRIVATDVRADRVSVRIQASVAGSGQSPVETLHAVFASGLRTIDVSHFSFLRCDAHASCVDVAGDANVEAAIDPSRMIFRFTAPSASAFGFVAASVAASGSVDANGAGDLTASARVGDADLRGEARFDLAHDSAQLDLHAAPSPMAAWFAARALPMRGVHAHSIGADVSLTLAEGQLVGLRGHLDAQDVAYERTLRARHADVRFERRGAHGTIVLKTALSHVALRVPGHTLRFDRVEALLATRDARNVTIRKLRATGPLGRATGEGTIGSHGAISAELHLALPSLQALREILPLPHATDAIAREIPDGQLAADVHVEARGTRSLAVRGDLTVTNLRGPVHFPIPDHPALAVPVTLARARFETSDLRGRTPSVALHGIEITGPMGDLSGDATFDGNGHTLTLRVAQGDPVLVRWLVPGTVAGGLIDGTLALHGDARTPVATIGGSFTLTGSRYTPPPELGLSDRPLVVSRFTGVYLWDHGLATLDHLVLHGQAVTGTGTIHVRGHLVQIDAELASDDLGFVTDEWPSLRGLVRGGSGAGHLTVAICDGVAHGALDVHARGGALVVPNAAASVAVQPMSTGALRLSFAPGGLEIASLSARGPQANFDLAGRWGTPGAVRITGRAWLTEPYSHQLLRGYNWLAHLFGTRALSTTFALDGSSDRVMLHAGITHSMLWRIGHGRIPRITRDQLSGRVPLALD